MTRQTPSRRALGAAYMAGFFSLSLLQMVALATPLFATHIGLSAVMLGLFVGSRSISPLIYSIHIGGLMDVVGVRRVLLLFSALSAVLPFLYPLFPVSGVLIFLQLLLGLASAVGWMAAQTAIARTGGGERKYTARFSFITVAGTVAGPLLLGWIWDKGGPWMGYGVISLWSILLFCTALVMPARLRKADRGLRWRDVVPESSAYRKAWQIVRRPLGAFVIACTFLRLAGFAVVESFYPVFLQGSGYTPFAIGALVALANLVSSPASLAADWWVRITGSDRRALLSSTGVAIVAITVTPLLQDFWSLAAAISIFGLGVGVSMPLILILLSRGVPSDQQGVAAGLRGTFNRLAAFVLPVVMGIVIEFTSIETAFWVIGLALFSALILLAQASRSLTP